MFFSSFHSIFDLCNEHFEIGMSQGVDVGGEETGVYCCRVWSQFSVLWAFGFWLLKIWCNSDSLSLSLPFLSSGLDCILFHCLPFYEEVLLDAMRKRYVSMCLVWYCSLQFTFGLGYQDKTSVYKILGWFWIWVVNLRLLGTSFLSLEGSCVWIQQTT